jgi:branched-chain amino acid transport system substrate-binding protein
MSVSRTALGMVLALLATAAVAADDKGDIRIGQTLPYSGPVSGFGIIGRAQEAYFEKVTAEGGINGRKIKFITLDDAYSPPKTVEQTRKLVEQDEVLLMFGSLGTATNNAVHRYLNAKKVPQLFVLSGATKWADPKNFPWTMPGMATYQSEGVVYAKYILQTKPDAKIAILSQNDDFGRDYVAGFKRALADCDAEGLRGQRHVRCRARQIHLADDQGRCRDQLEAGPVLRADLGVIDLVPRARGPGKRGRADFVEQPEGHDGCAMGR